MSKALFTLAMVLLAISLIAYSLYVSWLYYAGSCAQIKNFPVPTQVPNRCIRL